MDKQFLSISFILGAIAVAFGAFGAHALKEMVDEKTVQTWQTAVQYHFYHLFAIAITGMLLKQGANSWYTRAGYLFIAGIIIFSGSLYTMTLLKATGATSVNWLGAITPIGGVCFIAGWLLLFTGIRKK
jgi:uncharacterized membrane protein YgdD (TMEM256/DUF423 family)